jgi:hypothetical protein
MSASTCKSCGAPIEWAYTVKGSRMPLDPGMFDDGNVAVDEHGTARMTDERPARRSHFVSCPDAARHRRPKIQRPRGNVRKR